MRVDRENGWVWVLPVRDGAVDTSRVAIAVFHATLDNGDPNVMGYEIAPAAR